ncbi:MAG: hypothetical protein KA765_03750 [Thermoflexales bacterium]|nr:hypothetical protein [Thermoflexales bacterium]
MVVLLVMVGVGLGGRLAAPISQAQATDQSGPCRESLPEGYFTTDWKTACEKDAQPIGSSDMPQPGSKNASGPLAIDPNGVARSNPMPGVAAAVSPTAPQMTGDSRSFMACNAGITGNWMTTSTSWQEVRSCTATFPEDGFVYINATASLDWVDTPYEAHVALNVDNPVGNGTTDRWVNIYADSGNGTDKNVADDMIAAVSSGTHTFYFLVRRFAGSGTVELLNPNLSVLYFPSSNAEVMACGVTNELDWTTTDSAFQIVRSCTLSVTQPGYVYVSGTSSVAQANGPSEARLRVGVDSTAGLAVSDRWVNVYTDTGDGTDESAATSNLVSVVTGTHTFYLLAARYAFTGTVTLYDPSLSVLYFPETNVTAKTCGVTGADMWINATDDTSVIRSCTVDLPAAGFAFVTANASAGLNDTTAGNDWEGKFGLSLDDSTDTHPGFNRWLNVYTDAGDGTDQTLATSGMFQPAAGAHTFYLLGTRFGGATMRLYNPSLTVIVPVAHTYLPLATR